jgi:hypothetical protein
MSGEAAASASTGTEGAGAQAGAGAQPGAGAAAPTWFSGIDSETLGWGQNKGWFDTDPAKVDLPKVLPEVLKAHRNLESMVGRDKLVRPKDTADEAAWKPIRELIGVPQKWEDYGLVPIGADGKPDSKADRSYADGISQIAHKHHVSKTAIEEMAKYNDEYGKNAKLAADQQFETQSQQEVDGLRAQWGQDADGHFAAAQRAANAFGIDQPTMDKIERAIGTKTMLTLLSKIGTAVSEDRGSGGGGGSGLMSPEAANARLVELRGDKEWTKRYFAGDRNAVAEYDRLISTVASRR